MAEKLRLILDQDGRGREFDEWLGGTLPDLGDPVFVTKSNGTEGGQPIVMITFTVRCPDGSFRRAQTVMTARLFLQAAEGVLGAHPDCGKRLFPEQPAGTTIEGKHRGVGWSALRVDQCYIVSAEGSSGISLGFTEAEVEPLAQAAIDRIVDELS